MTNVKILQNEKKYKTLLILFYEFDLAKVVLRFLKKNEDDLKSTDWFQFYFLFFHKLSIRNKDRRKVIQKIKLKETIRQKAKRFTSHTVRKREIQI